ncbi:MAG TPA: hypothetical protein DEQ98_06540 [Acidobacteria bacterium]|nr:hypothetical protein [Alphaproteobacteria bacterium]MBN56232.1 hypothetical protein [Oceanospirillaceae bacterium]OUT40359.1 MAG: hypothetical protein CBB62_10250 [Micavibrio sp. TMED2]HCE02884.1 hypothetical protein [Acidobacteriota bacterium]MAS47984.1 hypothetical protein [Alphaproteobacteria bacterium]|tara:strand:- start:10728 stop:11162 length:435 start_codon:yes stop_codon:yes gene_type:complete
MAIDQQEFAPPEDVLFLAFVMRAAEGRTPVYGVALETDKVTLKRAFDSHRPERTEVGQEVLKQMMEDWRAGKHHQPWLYAKGDSYIVADDYFWLAMIERGNPSAFPALVFGEPLEQGLVEKKGPLGPDYVKQAFGNLLAQIEME